MDKVFTETLLCRRITYEVHFFDPCLQSGGGFTLVDFTIPTSEVPISHPGAQAPLCDEVSDLLGVEAGSCVGDLSTALSMCVIDVKYHNAPRLCKRHGCFSWVK